MGTFSNDVRSQHERIRTPYIVDGCRQESILRACKTKKACALKANRGDAEHQAPTPASVAGALDDRSATISIHSAVYILKRLAIYRCRVLRSLEEREVWSF